MTQPQWPPRSAAEYLEEATALLGEDLAGRFARVQACVLDADGVLTSGNLFYDAQGESFKEFDSQDGLGLVMARVAGIKLAILTGRNSPPVERRATELKFHAIRMGRFDKQVALAEILAELEVDPETTLYMGDDLLDLPALIQVAVPVTVPAAPEDVKLHCCYVTRAAAGAGAVREVLDLVLKCRGLFAEVLKRMVQAEPPATPSVGI